jgi:phosphatidylserine decarboxylase
MTSPSSLVPIIYIDRLTGQTCLEKIYKETALRLLYGDAWTSRLFSPWLLPLVSRWPFFSALCGYIQKRPSSRRHIQPFIQAFDVDTSEFLEPASQFHSFNDFFIRRLKPEVRPIHPDPTMAVIPADGRYYFYENIKECSGFIVKGEKFKLSELLHSSSLAQDYEEASMVIARLCPSDYHRFHFPCDGLPGSTQLISGSLYSVNPLAIKRNLQILTRNKRTLCIIQTQYFKQMLYIEIGATTVGSIQQTYTPNQWQKKGAEKGYFEFGGSALILLFHQGTILFDSDLLSATAQGLEIRCLFGQSMGNSQLKR